MRVYFEPKTEGIRECWIDGTPIEQGDVVRLSSFDEFSGEDQAVFKNKELFKPASDTSEELWEEFVTLPFSLLLVVSIVWVSTKLLLTFRKSNKSPEKTVPFSLEGKEESPE